MASLRLGPEAGCFPHTAPTSRLFSARRPVAWEGECVQVLGKERFIRFRGVALCLARDDCLVSS